jgi:very-short-patch-repair endonuclease
MERAVTGNIVPWLLLGIVLIALGLMAARLAKRASSSTSRWPVYAKRLLGEREQVLYWRLCSTFPEHVVLAQVALSQLLGVEKGVVHRQAVGNRFRQLCADFVICKRTFEPVAVIELDGRSHDHPRRQAADERKAAALDSAGVQLIRVNAARIPDEVELKRLLGRDGRESH